MGILPSGESIENEITIQKEYFIQNGKPIFPSHCFISGMSITHVHVTNIPIAFFNLMHTICGEEFVRQYASQVNEPIYYKLDIDINSDFHNTQIPDTLSKLGSNEIFNELKTMDFKPVLGNMAAEMYANRNDVQQQWIILWNCIEHIYNECDLIHTISYYSSICVILNYLFTVADSEEFQLYLSARVVEKMNNYMHMSQQYSVQSTGIRTALQERKKLPMFEPLFKYRKNGLNLPAPTPEFVNECQHFITYGRFTAWPNVPPSVLPYSDYPEDGLIFRLYLGIYLVSFNKMLSESVRQELKRELTNIFEKLITSYDNLKITIKALNMEPGKYLPIQFIRTAAPEINRDISHIYGVVYCGALVNAIQELNNTFIKTLCT